jgi:hypothetical protein
MGELIGLFLEMITPKSRPGKVIWGIVFVLMVIIVVIELIAS